MDVYLDAVLEAARIRSNGIQQELLHLGEKQEEYEKIGLLFANSIKDVRIKDIDFIKFLISSSGIPISVLTDEYRLWLPLIEVLPRINKTIRDQLLVAFSTISDTLKSVTTNETPMTVTLTPK